MDIDPNTIREQLANKQQEFGTRIAGAAKTADQFNPVNDPEISRLRGDQSAKLKELFSYDSQIAPTYFQPKAAPALPGEAVAQPEQMIIDPTIGMRASSAQTKSIGQELTDILSQIETRKSVISAERAKAMDMISLLLEGNKQEQSALEKQMDWYFKAKDQDLQERKYGASEGKDATRKAESIKIAKFFSDVNKADPSKNRAAAEKTAKLLVREGYDPELVYEELDRAFGKSIGGEEVNYYEALNEDIAGGITSGLIRDEFWPIVRSTYRGKIPENELRKIFNEMWPTKQVE